MKSILLDGLPEHDLLGGSLGEPLVAEIRRKGWTVDLIPLSSARIAACGGSLHCWTRTPGLCTCMDEGPTVAEKVIGSDLVVLLTRVTFGGYSSTLKKALDRLLPLLSPYYEVKDGETHQRPRYGQYPALIAVGVEPVPDEGAESTFRALVGRNAVNLHAPAHGVCFVDHEQPMASVRAQFGRVLHEVTAQRARAR